MVPSQVLSSTKLILGPQSAWLAARTHVAIGGQNWTLCGYTDASKLQNGKKIAGMPLKDRNRHQLEAAKMLLPALQDDLAGAALQVREFMASAASEDLLQLAHGLSTTLAQGIHLGDLPAVLSAALDDLRSAKKREIMGSAIRAAVRLSDYPETFLARSRRRKLIAVLGPTNSGKTYDAFVRLSTANSGVYLGPLRLLALEAFNRLNDEFDVKTSLLTGEDRRDVDGARLTASTIEMLNPDLEVEVAVIDEVQMLLDPDRGWAWTQAVVGANAGEVWLLGALSAEPAIRALAERLGLELEVRYKDRKHPLSVAPRPVAASPLASLEQAQKGDAWVVFSRRNALTLRDDFLDQGYSVACIYGMLTPEVREREARRFAQGEADILVATDAIGMGLNLPIQRVVFTSVCKYDGENFQELTVPLLQQIGGRAGRYGHQQGHTQDGSQDGVVVGVTPAEHRVVDQLMKTAQEPLAARGFLIAPSHDYLDRLAKLAGTDKLEALLSAYVQHADDGDGFFRAFVPKEVLDRAAVLDAMLNLPVALKHLLALAPLSSKHEVLASTWMDWVRKVNRNEAVGLEFLSVPPGEADLETAELAVQQLWAYLWLSYRLPVCFVHEDTVRELLESWVDAVDNHLRGDRRQGSTQRGPGAAWYRSAGR